MKPPDTRGLLAIGTVCVLLSGCAAEDTSTSDTPHGHVPGASENAEAQWRLVVSDTGGTVRLLDPATEEITQIDELSGVDSLTGDGRFGYASANGRTTVIDSGVWTVDHGDHKHYYDTDPGVAGTIDTTVDSVTGDNGASLLDTGEGVTALDRGALEDGEVETSETDAVAATRHAEQDIRVDGTGTIHAGDTTVDPNCEDPTATAVTDSGAVFGCRDGVVVVDARKTPKATEVEYPDGVDQVTRLDHRPGTPVLAAMSDDTVAVLRVADMEWSVIEDVSPVAACAAGEDLPVLVLDRDGSLTSFDPETAEPLTEREVIDDMPRGQPGPGIVIDSTSAYVNDPEAEAVHEIDYNDELRVARSLATEVRPDFVIETGW